MSGRLFYFSPSIFDCYSQRQNEYFGVSPSGKKISQVLLALRSVDVRTWAVCAPVVSGAVHYSYPASVMHERSYGVICFPAFRNRWINRFVAGVHYAWFALRQVHASDKVILYNYYPEYFLCALILFFKHNRAFLDIEDAPRSHIRFGFYEYLSRISFLLLRPVCRPRLIAASGRILRKYRNSQGLVVQGAAPLMKIPARDNWDTIHVLYSGAKTVEWGTEIFCDALTRIASWPQIMREKIVFDVTGHGDFTPIRSSAEILRDKLRINITEDAEPLLYESILSYAHIGLELRVTGSEGANTTFPSKVIELAARSKLVITTGTGGVVDLLGADGCMVLDTASGDALEQLLRRVVENPLDARLISSRGHANALSRVSEDVVGCSLKKFLNL